jgi:hypothetical protein
MLCAQVKLENAKMRSEMIRKRMTMLKQREKKLKQEEDEVMCLLEIVTQKAKHEEQQHREKALQVFKHLRQEHQQQQQQQKQLPRHQHHVYRKQQQEDGQQHPRPSKADDSVSSPATSLKREASSNAQGMAADAQPSTDEDAGEEDMDLGGDSDGENGAHGMDIEDHDGFISYMMQQFDASGHSNPEHGLYEIIFEDKQGHFDFLREHILTQAGVAPGPAAAPNPHHQTWPDYGMGGWSEQPGGSARRPEPDGWSEYVPGRDELYNSSSIYAADIGYNQASHEQYMGGAPAPSHAGMHLDWGTLNLTPNAHNLGTIPFPPSDMYSMQPPLPSESPPPPSPPPPPPPPPLEVEVHVPHTPGTWRESTIDEEMERERIQAAEVDKVRKEADKERLRKREEERLLEDERRVQREREASLERQRQKVRDMERESSLKRERARALARQKEIEAEREEDRGAQRRAVRERHERQAEAARVQRDRETERERRQRMRDRDRREAEYDADRRRSLERHKDRVRVRERDLASVSGKDREDMESKFAAVRQKSVERHREHERERDAQADDDRFAMMQWEEKLLRADMSQETLALAAIINERAAKTRAALAAASGQPMDLEEHMDAVSAYEASMLLVTDSQRRDAANRHLSVDVKTDSAPNSVKGTPNQGD